jgi:hypothetical protein
LAGVWALRWLAIPCPVGIDGLDGTLRRACGGAVAPGLPPQCPPSASFCRQDSRTDVTNGRA